MVGAELHVVPRETVERWRREERIEQAMRKFARGIVLLCWWTLVFCAGYLTGVTVTVLRAASSPGWAL